MSEPTKCLRCGMEGCPCSPKMVIHNPTGGGEGWVTNHLLADIACSLRRLTIPCYCVLQHGRPCPRHDGDGR